MRIAVLISGSGSNLQALIDGAKTGKLAAEIILVLSNNPEAYGLKRAESAGIPNYVLPAKNRDERALEYLEMYKIELIVLAGYLKKIGSNILEKYKGKIINIHPSLLPKYGGEGMYGMKVHEAVIRAGEKITGVTLHLVTEDYDQGPILAQIQIPVEKDDTPKSLAARVLCKEHEFLVDALNKFLSGK